MTHAREDGHDLLREAWQRTDQIFGLLAPEALLARPIPLRQPFIFYVGHLPAFAWNHLCRGVLGRASFDEAFDVLFERGIDPPDDAEAPVDAAAWPEPAAVIAYRDRVNAELLETLERPEVRVVLPMVIEHYQMHYETLLYMVHQLLPELKLKPGWLPPPVTGRGAERRSVSVPAGCAVLGAPRDSLFRWDNEQPEQVVDVPAFAIDIVPVTNRELLAFVEAGGYREQRLWTEDAWRWREARHVEAPQFWTKTEAGFRVRALFEELSFDAAADWPAYVTHCEAAAYALWAGARLPSEPEFHRAAYATPEGGLREHPWGDAPPAPEHANLGLRHWDPTPAGSHPAGASAFGVHELVGNGWEWTASPFAPFPGFTPLPRYPGYSADFFDGRHFVLLGGSWATDPRLVRRSFRNWFQPHYPYVFAKFRCVRSA